MDPTTQLLLLCAGIALYAWADRRRLLSQVRGWIGPVMQRASLTLGRLNAAGGPLRGESAPTRPQAPALLTEGWRWLLVGAPGSGKTTAARQIVRAYLRAGASVTILDPDGGAWPRGCRMVGGPDDYEAIRVELDKQAKLATTRRGEFQTGVRSFAPILLLIDEAPAVLRQTPGAIECIADLARRGRKLGISLILLAQDTQTRTLGLEGQSRLLEAFERLDCRMTPGGVALSAGDTLRSTTPLDHGATDLELPVEAPVQPATLAGVDRLLESALHTRHTNGTTPMATAHPEPEPVHRPTLQPDPIDSLPPELVARLSRIDWRTVAELVEGNALGETAALKALGFPPSSTSAKYAAARARLQAARAQLAREEERM